MSRNLVICTDGTWNTPDQKDRGRVVPSNVVKVCRALAGTNNATSTKQLLYYDTGVGTGRWDRLKGGALGVGLSDNVLEAYAAIAKVYQEGDRLFIFGFSRGAYTARSLAGLIGLCGIPNPGKGSLGTIVKDAFEIYRLDSRTPDVKQARAAEHVAAWSRHDTQGRPAKEVWFIGVWDTVGALGVPLRPLNWIGARKHKFHNVSLGTNIRHAYHAIGIDERRRPFTPTLWLDKGSNAGQNVEQLWFVGVHSNVGGGYLDSGLSDRALLWMCAKAKAAGLAFREDFMHKRLDPNYHGELRDSLSLGYKILRPFLRPIGGQWESADDGRHCPALKEGIHGSARDRHRHPTEQAYGESPGGANLGAALDAGQPAVRPGLREETEFHTGDISWNGDETAPEPIHG